MPHPDFSRIIYALQEPVLLVEPGGTIVAANACASRLFRRTLSRLVGERLTALVTDDPEKLIQYLRQCSQNSARLPGVLHIRPLRHQQIACKVAGGLARKKQRRLVWLRLLPRDPANPRQADYNKQQEARLKPAGQQDEQRWRTAFENSAIGIIMADFTGRIIAANSAFRNMLGYTEAELYKLTFLDITYRKDREANLKLVRELAEDKRQHFQIEKRYCRKDGTLIWVRANVALVPGERDVEPFWLNVVEDITARKVAEQALQKTQAELARFSRLTTMGELAASIAHEINQPLTAVTNNSNACLRLLADHNLQPDVLRRALEEIVTEATHASAVIARIRAFIMKEPAEKIELDINEVIQAVLALTAHDLDENRILLERQLTEPLPLVLGERVQLQQVLLNLIVNGIEAMSSVANRPRFLWVESRLDEPGNVMVVIRDSGTGLRSEAERVFKSFFTTKAHGMGMGLSISRSVVEGLGGRLWAKPNFPQGAVFSFTLPISTGVSRE
jgi:PAS domain S-box-containing protein